jgi:predicted aspartyl protease
MLLLTSCYLAVTTRFGAGTTLPFRLVRDEIVAKAEVNGHLMTVLLDTGAAPSIIDRSLSVKYGFKFTSAGTEGSGGGTKRELAYELAPRSLKLGSLEIKQFDAIATDLTALSKKFGIRIDAVLGDSVFSDRIVRFDYQKQLVSFFDGAPSRTVNSVSLPFVHEDSEVHVIGMKVNGVLVKANLDTGANNFCSLTPRGIHKLKLDELVAHAPKTEAAGFNGSYSRRSGKLESISFGKYSEEKPIVDFWEVGTGHDDRDWDVNVGNRFLKKFVVTIDYKSKTVTCSKSD